MERNPTEGYTLFELLIVVIIVGLLSTIAVGVFNKQRATAKNGAATAALTSAYRSASQEYSSDQQWPSTATALASTLSQDEQGFQFKPFVHNSSESTGNRDITVTVEDADMVTFCNQSTTGLYFCLRTDSLAGLPVQVASVGTDGGLPGPLAIFDPPPANAVGYTSDSAMVARSTGSTEKEARDALPTRGHPGVANGNSATYWADCVGSCATAGSGTTTTTTTTAVATCATLPTTPCAISPVLECVDPVDENGYSVAHFGWNNTNGYTVNIPNGNSNKFTPAISTPPTAFSAGRQRDQFQVPWNTGGNLVWTLNGRTSTASPSFHSC